MSWREAFLRQARSENDLRHRLNDSSIAYSHRLHYLQMVAEKLAKGLQAELSDPSPPPASHHAFVRLMQTLKGRRDLRRQLGFDDAGTFRRYLDSLLDLADRLERLAPSAAGMAQPNPEYPWRDGVTGEIRAPVDYLFPFFDPRKPKMIKLEKLIDQLIWIAS